MFLKTEQKALKYTKRERGKIRKVKRGKCACVGSTRCNGNNVEETGMAPREDGTQIREAFHKKVRKKS